MLQEINKSKLNRFRNKRSSLSNCTWSNTDSLARRAPEVLLLEERIRQVSMNTQILVIFCLNLALKWKCRTHRGHVTVRSAHGCLQTWNSTISLANPTGVTMILIIFSILKLNWHLFVDSRNHTRDCVFESGLMEPMLELDHQSENTEPIGDI